MNAPEALIERRRRRATWVALRVMPHEAQSRAWLRRARVPSEEADDLVQEAYCRLALLEDVDHIDHPGAYFFSIIRNLLIRQKRAAAVVSLEDIAQLEATPSPDVSPEAEVGMRLDAARARALISELPGRCRRIVEMRKLEGYSQVEIAQLLGVTESVVENNIYRGMKAVLQKWTSRSHAASDQLGVGDANRKGISR